MLAISGAIEPSLINLRVTDVDAGHIERVIVAVLEAAGKDLLAGAVVTVNDAGVRVHHLPIG